MHHQWIEGNLPVASKCAVCDKTCGSVIRYIDFLHPINRKYKSFFPFCDIYFKLCLTNTIIRLQDWRCLWCRACVHATCRANFIQNCSFGETRTATVPPTCLIKHQGIISFHFTISPIIFKILR